jgi:hypothetical protein
MNKAFGQLKKIGLYIKKNWFIFFVIISYLFFTVYYMGPASWNCTNIVNGFGDSTAGPIWKNTMSPDQPFGSISNSTNYPAGEALGSAVDAVVSGQTLVLWGISKAVGPICSYNLTIMLGYLSTAILMFGFVYTALSSRFRWIAWLAGYAVAFAPYFQVKTAIHPGYAFQGLIIAAIWVFLLLIKTRKLRWAIILALLIAICFYFDPYLSLLVGTAMLAMGLGWLGVGFYRIKHAGTNNRVDVLKLVSKQAKKLAVAIGLFVLFILPIVFIGLTQASNIEKAVAGTRDNIQQMAKACSNWPGEYLLPFPDSPLFKVFGSETDNIKSSLYKFSQCGIAEDAVGVSIVALISIFLLTVVLIWDRLQGKRLKISQISRYDSTVLIVGISGVIVLAGVMAFPPFYILGVPSPSALLISLSSVWRVIAREYVVVNIGVVILSSVALAYFSSNVRVKSKWKVFIFVGLFLITFIQYQTYRPFGGLKTQFNYSQAPDAYAWLKNQKNIKAIAEYPMEKATEANSLGYYLTMQSIHQKPMFNSALGVSSQDGVRSLLKNIADPQTVPTLRALGVTTVVIHGVEEERVKVIPGLEIVYSGNHSPDSRVPESPSVTNDKLVIAQIIQNYPTEAAPLQVKGKLPKNATIEHSSAEWAYEVPSGTTFIKTVITHQKNKQITPSAEAVYKVCMNVRTALNTGNSGLLLKQGLKTTKILDVDGIYKQADFLVKGGEDFRLVLETGENIRISKIGCN